MTKGYDKYYQSENYFGNPYPELIRFFADYPKKGKVLDLGCGQGRDAIAIARKGYSVKGIDSSKVGINQMNQIANAENLDLIGEVEDIYCYDKFAEFDFILLDSMFHFLKKDKQKEIQLIRKIVSQIKNGCLLVLCIQDSGDKVQILKQALDLTEKFELIDEQKFKYAFEDPESAHISETNYQMLIAEKL